MKLRQKLAVALASAMVITSVPVVTMAASTATVSKTVTVANDTILATTTAPVLKLNLQHKFNANQEFYLALENAEWVDETIVGNVMVDGVAVGTVTVNDGQATVSINQDVAAGKSMEIKLDNIKVTGEAAAVIVDGNETEVSDAKIVFANQSDAMAKVTSKNDKTFYITKGSEISEIVVEESVVGTFKDAHKIVIDLENGDYEFVQGSTVTVTGTKGINGTITPTKVEITEDAVEITLPKATNTSKGGYKISGIKVASVDKEPAAGDLEVTVSGEKVADRTKTVEKTTLAVAKIAEYGTTLTVKEKKEVVAGESTEVQVTLKENTADSISTGDVEFTLTEGVMMEEPTIKQVSGTTTTTVATEKITMVPKDKKDLTKGYTGFIVELTGTTAVDQLVATAEIFTEVGTEAEIAVEVDGRFIEDQSVVVAEVAPNFSVETEAMVLKVGQSKQVGGKLVITETEEGTFKKGTTFEIEVAKEDGITLTDLPTVEATNGMTVTADWKEDSASTTSATIVVEVTKASRDGAAEITVKDFEVKTDRTVPEGSYDLELTVEDLRGTVEVEDFLVVGTPNTEDLASNGLAKGTSSFVIGEAKYTVNGVEKTMDAASYIQDPGYTMVPIRYVAEAFGVKASDILFSNGVATIFAGSRTVQLTNGSDVAVVNGVQIKMATKVTIKDGRTYAPIGEVAQLLGLEKSWDSTSKTATFINK